ncbi:MAG: ferrous iron transport protein B [Alloprevotella sp.]|nr:ferrous iron transport protein B [Alloprevotella sp.]
MTRDKNAPVTLRDLSVGQVARVTSVGGQTVLRQHFLDMGLLPNTLIRVVKFAPLGDPVEISLHGYSLTLRLDDAAQIAVEVVGVEEFNKATQPQPHIDAPKPIYEYEEQHPGLGEGGRYHDYKHQNPLPDKARLTFVLAGNQNSGKTTLFNQLTGANQHVGNFPGVTVDKKSGPIRTVRNSVITDLPGIYSLSPCSQEEIVARNFILNSHPRGIINIVDATNIERNLYLTMQLLELGLPMVITLNMMDEVKNNHGTIRVNEMERMLGVPVIPISAMKNEGIGELIEHAVHVAHFQEYPLRQDFCDKQAHGGAVHRCIHAVMHLIENHAERAHIPVRFAATKLIEGDQMVTQALRLEKSEQESIESLIRIMEHERGLDRAAAIADMRFAFINHLCAHTVVKPQLSKERRRSDRIDRLLTGRWTGIPAFFAIIALIFYLTFFVIGTPLQDLATDGMDALADGIGEWLQRWEVNAVVASLVTDGIVQGVGTVVTFLPLIVTLFFFLSMLEDSGYMARIAFVADSFLRKIGLSGRSIVPLLIGFGCSVPSVMATRTLSSDRDRKLTVMLIPFMSCTAKLPIYGFFCAAFFPQQAWIIITALYFIGIAVGIGFAFCTRRTLFRGDPVPFVMELPVYRIPGIRNVIRLLWDKARDFLQRAFTVIFLATIVIWFLQTFDFHLNLVNEPSDSILATVASFVAPVFSPMHFGDWRVATALVTGFMAKESVVATTGMLFGSTANMVAVLTPLAAFALLVFCLLYTPCVAAVASIRRELGMRWMVGIIVLQCVIAWLVSFIVYQIGALIL